MSDQTKRTKTVQAQYYSNMFDGRWIDVIGQKGNTKLAARRAIKEHCKTYHQTTKTREFRIVTTVVSTRIEDVE